MNNSNLLHADLPEALQAALSTHESCKTTYQNCRDRLTTLGKQLSKHRNTRDVAEWQAKQVGTAWREAFRAAEGELTKAIRDQQRQENEQLELSKEYARLVQELEPEFSLCQLDTYDARTAYLSSRRQAYDQYADHCLNTAAAELFAVPQAKAFFAALKRKGVMDAWSATPDKHLSPGGVAEHWEAIKKGISNTDRVVCQVIQQAVAQHTIEEPDDAHWQSLNLISKLNYESIDTKLSSPIQRGKHRAALQEQMNIAKSA